MRRTIIWEKWIDQVTEEKDTEDVSIYDDRPPAFIKQFMPIKTPIGLCQENDPFLPSKMFDCWIGHTNFDICEKDRQILIKTQGIEILRIMSRYRFFIGIGKQFSFSNVRRILNKNLCGYISKEDEQDQYVFKKMSNQSGRWAVFLPNTGKEEIILESDPNFDEKLESFYKRNDGRVLTSQKASYSLE